MVHAAGDNFDAVSDDLARDEAVAHALVPHHDAVGSGRSAEDLRHAAGSTDTLTALAGQAVEVGVTGRDVAEQRRHADHWPVEILVEKADGPEHGAVGGAAHAVGGHAAAGFAIGSHDAYLSVGRYGRAGLA